VAAQRRHTNGKLQKEAGEKPLVMHGTLRQLQLSSTNFLQWANTIASQAAFVKQKGVKIVVQSKHASKIHELAIQLHDSTFSLARSVDSRAEDW
jgi:hypothetical protein